MKIKLHSVAYYAYFSLFSLIFLISCGDKGENETNNLHPQEVIELWAQEYFQGSSRILPSELAEFAQIAIGSLYEFENRGTALQIDTIDMILDTPHKSTISNSVEFTLSVLENIRGEIEMNQENMNGVVVLPRRINGSMYTRVLLLYDKHAIVSRNKFCSYEDDYNWKNAQTCTETESYNMIAQKFNLNRCNWTLPHLLNCELGTTRTYRVAPSLSDDDFTTPCNSFSECFNLASTLFNPQICNAGSTTIYCDLIETGNSVEPRYKLFHRNANVESQCISSDLMNQYQDLVEEFALDILSNSLYNLDLSWRYKSIFLDYQGANASFRSHTGVFLYEKCVAKFTLGN